MTSSVRAEPSATAGRRLRDDPDFRYFWCARTLSSIGSVVTLVALPILVFRLTGSTLLTAVTSARGGFEERIYVRGDRKVDYGTVMRVMGRLSSAGFRRVALVTEVEQGP